MFYIRYTLISTSSSVHSPFWLGSYCVVTNTYIVVKNPLSPVEHPGGEGVANELFELALDQFVKGVL